MLLAAGALNTGQLAAVTLAATFLLSVLERLLKRWKASCIALQHDLPCCCEGLAALAAAAAELGAELLGDTSRSSQLSLLLESAYLPIRFAIVRRSQTRAGSSLSCSRRWRTCSARRRR